MLYATDNFEEHWDVSRMARGDCPLLKLLKRT